MEVRIRTYLAFAQALAKPHLGRLRRRWTPFQRLIRDVDDEDLSEIYT